MIVASLLTLLFSAPTFASHNIPKKIELGIPTVVQPTERDEAAGDALEQYVRGEHVAYDQGDAKKVIASLDRAIQVFPDIAMLYVQRAAQLQRVQQWERASADLQTALRIDPANVEAHVMRAQLLAVTERVPEAVVALRSAVDRGVRSKEILLTLARLYIQLKDYPHVEWSLRALLQYDPESFEAYFGLGNLYAAYLKQPARGIAMFRKAINLLPENLQARQALAQLLIDQKQPRAALATLIDLEQHAVGDVSVQLRIAALYYELKDVPHAIERLERVLVTNPHADKLRYYLGVLYDDSGNHERAAVVLREIPPESQFYKDAMLRIAILLQKQGQREQAIAHLRTAIDASPKVSEFYDYLAFLYEENHEDAKAAQILARAAGRFKARAQLFYTLGVLYERLGERSKAVDAMRRVIDLEPKNVQALNYVGFMYAEWGRKLSQAEEFLQRAVLLAPRDGHVIDSLAWLYYRRGDLEQAHTLIERANQASPNEPIILRHFALILDAEKSHDDAVAMLRHALTVAGAKSDLDAEEKAALEKLAKSWGVS